MLRDSAILYGELFVSVLLAVTGTNGFFILFFISKQIPLYSLVFYILFLTYAIAYLIRGPRLKRTSGKTGIPLVFFHVLFIAIVAFFILALASDSNLSIFLLVSNLHELFEFGMTFIILLPLLFFAFFAAYFIKVKHEYKPAYVLLAVVLAMLVLFYSSKFFLQRYIIDDEQLLSFESVRALLNGTNPYTNSITQLLYKHVSDVGITITTNNNIISVMDYPALFFLSLTPFYFLSSPTIYNLGAYDMTAQATVFLFILVTAFALLVDKEDLLKPKIALIAVLAISLSAIASTTQFLMLALVIIAYAKIDSKYAFVPLGLCAALQEELWLPVLFLLIYSLNKHGIKKGAYNIIGTAAIFLVINAYFIALGPAAYFNAILGTLNKPLIPIQPSAFSFMLMKNYAIQLSTYPMLFKILIVISAFVLLYTNRKELIPVFSLITLLTLTHALLSYYVLFLFFMFFAVCTWQKNEKDGIFQKFLRRKRILFYAGLFALIAFMAFTIYSSHAAYMSNFNIRLVNQSVAIDASGNRTIYSGDMLYRGLTNDTIYLFAIDYVAVNYRGGEITVLGFANQSLISNPQRCGANNYTCLVNTNKITLSSNSTSHHLTVIIPWADRTAIVNRINVDLYNGDYFYVGDPVYNYSKPS